MAQQIRPGGTSTLALNGGGTWINPNYNYGQGSFKTGSSSAGSASGVAKNSGLSDYMQFIQNMTQANNRWSAAQADKQMQFQKDQNKVAMDFNAEQADISRKWQEYMSNTAHQREIKDLKAAGLNPVLSAMGGNGAPVTSGATASGYTSSGAMGQTDMSGPGALVSLLGSVLSAQTAQANAALSAQTNLAVAEKYTAMQKVVSELQSKTQLTTNRISALASMYNARTGASATITAAGIHAAAQRYGYDISALTNKEIAGFNAIVNAYLQDDKQAHDFDIKEAYPSNLFGVISSLAGQFTGNEGMSGAVDSAKDLINDLVKDFTGKDWTGGRR